MRRREQDPQRARIRADQHHRPVAAHRVEHAPHVVDRVFERREPTSTVGETLAPLVHHDQPSEARDSLDDLPVPRKLLAHPDVADHRGHDKHVDRTVAVDDIRDVEAVTVGVAKSGLDHDRESRTLSVGTGAWDTSRVLDRPLTSWMGGSLFAAFVLRLVGTFVPLYRAVPSQGHSVSLYDTMHYGAIVWYLELALSARSAVSSS